MSSWVRYSVAAYLGLLISGALAQQPRQGPSAEPTTAPSVHYETTPRDRPLPPMPEPKPRASKDVAV